MNKISLEEIKKITARVRPLARNWRFLSLKKLLYLPRVLSHGERRFFLLLVAVVLVTGGGFFTRTYLKFTKPVADVGGSYTEGLLKRPITINPIYASQDTDRDISRLIFSGLLTYSGEAEIKPDLAEKYEISGDGKVYLVTLKKNIYWHDGRKLTADDVIFTIRTIQNPQYKSVLRADWQGVTVDKVNDQTVRFTLRVPYSPFIENLTTGIIPKHLWENVTPDKALIHELNLKPIGSGPYKFSDFEKAKDGSIIRYELTRNSKYHNEGPYLKKIVFEFFDTEDEVVAALHKGRVDGYGPLSLSKAAEFDLQKVNIRALAMPRIFGIFFNTTKSDVLADSKVRQAIAYAVNKNGISKQATSGGATPAELALPFSNSSEETSGYSYDPEKAKKILEADGWKSNPDSPFRNKKIGKETKSLEISLVTSDWPDLLRTAEILKNNFKEIGLNLKVERKSYTDLEQSVIRPRNFEMLLFGQAYGYEQDPFAFWHSSQIKDPGLNIAGYSNKKADKLLEEARRTSDEDIRRQKYEQFADLVEKDLPAVFLYSQLYLYLVPSDLHGLNLAKISLPSDRFNEINKWYTDTSRVFSF